MKSPLPVFTAFAFTFALVGPGLAVPITALTSAGTLVSFDSATPGTITNTVPVTGLTTGDTLVGIDYRPIDGQLIGFGYNSAAGTARVYSLTLGVATSINANTITLGTALNRVTADFNPTANAIRVVTSATTSNNQRIPTAGTGVPVIDGDLNTPANAGIRATAYSRNNAGGGTSGATTLYEIDGTNNALVTQGSVDFFTGTPGGVSPNTGTLANVANLTGVTGSAITGFDIYNLPGTAATSAGSAFLSTGTTLYSLDLGSAAATSLGIIGSSLNILDIAAVPEPSTLVLGGLALTLLAVRIRKARAA